MGKDRTMILKRGAVRVSARVLTGWQLLITAVPIGIGALVWGDGHWFMPSWTTIIVITCITLVPMAIGNATWCSTIGLLPTTVAGLSSILVPVAAMVAAMVAGALMHGEPLVADGRRGHRAPRRPASRAGSASALFARW